jgi:hypothetical protein
MALASSTRVRFIRSATVTPFWDGEYGACATPLSLALDTRHQVLIHELGAVIKLDCAGLFLPFRKVCKIALYILRHLIFGFQELHCDTALVDQEEIVLKSI